MWSLNIFSTSKKLSSLQIPWKSSQKEACFRPKNTFFCILADNGRIGDIWPEIDPRGVLKPFCTRIRYLIAYMKHFTKIEKNRFFEILICGYGQKLTSKWPNPADIGRKIFPAGLDTPCLFPEKNVKNNSWSFRR